ncbi:hypothetical protein [Mesorhizobium sp. LjNodule214]|uniref:hypothetical protein n=1 Tax=Mesorhizobium sp. LjNodule214 TaxID=3342252 RepID=UPI003ED06995
MTARIPPGLMEPLADAIADAFETNDLDRIVKTTTGKGLFQAYAAENKPRNQIAYELIARLDQLGTHLVVLSAMLALRREDNLFRDIVGRACPEALQDLPSTASQVRDIIAGTEQIRLRIDEALVRSAVVEAKSELAEVADALLVLDIYKQLHDCLHQLQIKQFHSLRAAARDFPTDPVRMETLREYQSQLRSESIAIGRQIKRLPGPVLQPMEKSWYVDLEDAVRRFQLGVDQLSKDETLLALRDIKGTMRRIPQHLNKQIFSTVEGIRLDVFSEVLSKVAEALAPDNAEIQKAHSALQIVRPTINARVVEHKKWQEADNCIAALDELFDRKKPQEEDEFLPYWNDTKRRVGELAALSPLQDWSLDVARYADAIDREIEREGDDGGSLKRAFGDYWREARFQFLVVDTELKSECESLVSISDPLKAVLARLDNA